MALDGIEVSSVYQKFADSIGISLEAAVIIIVLILIWKLTWYGIALYKTIERKQKVWFVVLFLGTFILSDLGILPIIYLLVYREKKPKKLNKKK